MGAFAVRAVTLGLGLLGACVQGAELVAGHLVQRDPVGHAALLRGHWGVHRAVERGGLTPMLFALVEAQGDRPEMPVWGEVVLVIVWAIAGVWIISRLRKRRRRG
ncbi:hypothetical protein GCM10010431_34610 [Streptomyces kunmingensis]